MGVPSGKVNYRATFGSPVLASFDVLISMCVVAPLVVGYWRGTWDLLNMYLYPGPSSPTSLSCWLSVIIGFATLLVATWFQQELHDYIIKQNCCVFFMLSRLYTVIVCFGSFLLLLLLFSYLR